MKRNRFTEEQITGILKEHEAGVSVADLCRKHGVSDARVCSECAPPNGCGTRSTKGIRQVEADKAMTEHQRAQTAFHEYRSV